MPTPTRLRSVPDPTAVATAAQEAVLQTSVSGLQTTISGLLTSVSGLQTSTTGLQTTTSGLQTTTSGLQTSVSGLQTSVTNLQNNGGGGGGASVPGGLARTIGSFRVSSTTTDDQVIQSALDWMSANSMPLVPGGSTLSLNLTKTAIHTGQYFNADFTGVTLGGKSMAKGVCTAATVPDLTLPTRTYPGPLEGSGIMVADAPSNFYAKNLAARDCRFMLSFLNQPNAPVFVNPDPSYCDCGIIFYQGLQTAQILNPTMIAGGVLVIGGGTCFPATGPDGVANPYIKLDNGFTDGVRVGNYTGYGTFQAITARPYFDNFHIASFQRPGTDSFCYPSGAPSRYYNSGGTEYAANSYYRQPTGRIVFCPGVNGGRLANTFFWHNTDNRGKCERGLVLMNCPVSEIQITGGAWERLEVDGLTVPCFEFASIVHSGLINCTAFTPNATQDTHPLIRIVNGTDSLTSLAASGDFVVQGRLKLAGGPVDGAITNVVLTGLGLVAGAVFLSLGTSTADYYINHVDGGFYPQAGYTASGIVAIPAAAAGKTLTASSGLFHAAFYNSAGAFLASWNNSVQSGTSPIPSGAASVRASTQTAAYAGLTLSYQ